MPKIFIQLCAMAFGFKSQLTATHDKEQTGLIRIQKLEQTLSTKKTRIS